jgi:hypothetical protein
VLARRFTVPRKLSFLSERRRRERARLKNSTLFGKGKEKKKERKKEKKRERKNKRKKERKSCFL